MTDYDYLLARLQTAIDDDHERGCQGRNYACTCGLDSSNQITAQEAAALIRRLLGEIEARDKFISATDHVIAVMKAVLTSIEEGPKP